METARQRLQSMTFCWAIALLLVAKTGNADQTEFGGTVLYEQDGLTVLVHEGYQINRWCNGEGLIQRSVWVTYNVPHTERERLIGPSYEEFVRTIVYPSIIKQCGQVDVPKLGMSLFKAGDEELWDAMGFDISNDGRTVVKTAHSGSKEAKFAQAARTPQIEGVWGLGRCAGEFCGLTGGIYLNAIYENNAALIENLDRQILAEMRSNPYIKNLSKFASILYGQETEFIGAEGFSLLKLMSIKYMALYNGVHASQSCLLEGATSMSRKSDIDIVEFEDQFGNDQGAVDIGFGHTYVINKEFIPLCNKICDASGADGADFAANSVNSDRAKLVLNGTGQVLSALDCNDPRVKQFERNLISLTERYLLDPTARATTPAPVAIDERASGASFLADNKTKDGVVVTPSGLQYIIIAEGSGAHPELPDTVTFNLRGTLVDGRETANTYANGQPSMNILGEIPIKGVSEGLQLIRPGGKIKLFMPPALAFGKRQVGALIKPDSTLIYEVELISIN